MKINKKQIRMMIIIINKKQIRTRDSNITKGDRRQIGRNKEETKPKEIKQKKTRDK